MHNLTITFVRRESNASLRLNIRLRSLIFAARRCDTVATLRRFLEGREALKEFISFCIFCTRFFNPIFLGLSAEKAFHVNLHRTRSGFLSFIFPHFNFQPRTCFSWVSLELESPSRPFLLLFLRRRRRFRCSLPRCSRARSRRQGSPPWKNG